MTLAVLGAGVVGGLSARAFDGDDPAPAPVVETPAAVTTPSAPSTEGSSPTS